MSTHNICVCAEKYPYFSDEKSDVSRAKYLEVFTAGILIYGAKINWKWQNKGFMYNL